MYSLLLFWAAVHAFYPREWSLAWEGIDFRPPRNATTSGASTLPQSRIKIKDIKAGGALVYPSDAVKRNEAARLAQIAQVAKGNGT